MENKVNAKVDKEVKTVVDNAIEKEGLKLRIFIKDELSKQLDEIFKRLYYISKQKQIKNLEDKTNQDGWVEVPVE